MKLFRKTFAPISFAMLSLIALITFIIYIVDAENSTASFVSGLCAAIFGVCFSVSLNSRKKYKLQLAEELYEEEVRMHEKELEILRKNKKNKQHALMH